MKHIFALCTLFAVFQSCVVDSSQHNQTHSNQRLFYNLKCVIKEKGRSKDGYYFLIEPVEYSYLRTELNSYNWTGLNAYAYGNRGTILFYSKKEGDTLYFDHISRARFWNQRYSR